MCEALKGWLDLSGIPASIVRNAYLHFEALSNHPYNYFCILCGHNPYLLITDADKKGMFDLSGKCEIIFNNGSHTLVLIFLNIMITQ